MTWRRVGSLTSFSRVAARCMVIDRLASFATLVVFVAFFILRIDVVSGICLQKECDRLEAGRYITHSAGKSLGPVVI